MTSLKKSVGFAAFIAIAVLSQHAKAETCEPNRWTITLEQLAEATDDDLATILSVLDLDLDVATLRQAIDESAVPLTVFGME